MGETGYKHVPKCSETTYKTLQIMNEKTRLIWVEDEESGQ